jgi:hypothetical protein
LDGGALLLKHWSALAAGTHEAHGPRNRCVTH